LDGTYRQNNPTWDVKDSAEKARQVLGFMDENRLQPKTVIEVGCGAGQILVELARYLPDASFKGFEVSPQAICKPKESERVTLELRCLEDAPESADVLLVMDVFEHEII
jgi:tRNA G46 methylase TrmB